MPTDPPALNLLLVGRQGPQVKEVGVNAGGANCRGRGATNLQVVRYIGRGGTRSVKRAEMVPKTKVVRSKVASEREETLKKLGPERSVQREVLRVQCHAGPTGV